MPPPLPLWPLLPLPDLPRVPPCVPPTSCVSARPSRMRPARRGNSPNVAFEPPLFACVQLATGHVSASLRSPRSEHRRSSPVLRVAYVLPPLPLRSFLLRQCTPQEPFQGLTGQSVLSSHFLLRTN